MIVVLAFCGCVSYPLWNGYGAWQTLPTDNVPSSQTLDDVRFTDAGQQALEAIKSHRDTQGFPALTAAVAIDGGIVWTGAVGWADLAGKIPAARDTVLRIGSTSKAVTATALARLVDRGEMSLDAPLSDYHNQWPNSAWNDLTPRQLASHTAGLPDYENNGDRMGQMITLCGCRHYASVVDSLTIFDGSDLIYEPGTDFAYSSFDVSLLGAAIAISQEQSFLNVLDRLVFSPLELVTTGSESDGRDWPHLAQFYQQDEGRVRKWKPFDLSQRLPGGGLVSTSSDLVRIGCSWLDPAFISIETRQAMWTPQVLRNGKVNEQSYAIGWRYYPDAKWPGDDSRALPFAHHGGTTKGAMSWLVVYPDYRLSIAVNINTRTENYSDFNSVEGRIAALFLARLDQLWED